MLLLKFITNFVAIIVFAVALEGRKRELAHFVVGDDDIDLEMAANGIDGINTISVTFASAVNAYTCFVEQSATHLTLIGGAYLTDLILFLVIARTGYTRSSIK